MKDPQAYFQTLSKLLGETQVTSKENQSLALEEGFARAVDLILNASHKIMVIGNGGSAAIASHIQNDLCKAVGVRALVFNEPPFLTAVSNDHGYEASFERPVSLWAQPGDLLLALSSSGRSENILRAVRSAKRSGCQVLTFSGFRAENPLRQLGDLNFYVASEFYGLVEVAHMALTHYLTDCAMSARTKPQNACR